jgi:hypothetical protein
MKKIFYSLAWIITIQFFLYGCQEDIPKLGAPPTAEDATFTLTPTAENVNIIQFSSPSGGFLKKWDFGNGTKGEGDVVKGIYPLKGTYDVILTVYTNGGSISSKQTVEIAKTDPTLLDIPVYNMLTGGSAKPDGKTWVIDATTKGHFGVGPADGITPSYYAAGPNEKAGAGMYDDKYTFKLAAFTYLWVDNGDVFVNNKQQANFPGAYANAGDYTAPYTVPQELTWTVTTDAGNNQFLTISTGGFIGYYTGISKYQIMSLTDTKLVLKYLDAADASLSWFLTLIPDGFTPPVDPKATLPIDFEGAKPPFEGFEGAALNVIDNPHAGGINTSAKVGEYVKGTQVNYAGILAPLSAKLDFSTNTLVKFKIYSPVTGDALFKLEAIDGSAPAIEKHVNITKVGEWEELTYDFAGTASNVYDRIVVILDLANNAGGTFYIDDIKQAAETAELTEAKLTGGGSKAWVLKPAVGAFGVGPAKGSDAYYPNGLNISTDRPCLFNDEFIFKTGGVYQYDSKGDIWGETYFTSVNNACTDESTLLPAATTWGSATHSFTFTPAAGSDPAYITVTGTGAFIALPKAHNGGEYTAGPPATDGSVTYEVMSYVKNGTNETLSLTLDIGGGTFWNFVLINKQ